jgi:hypothetical protein
MTFDLRDGGSEKWLKHWFRKKVAECQLATLRKHAPNMTAIDLSNHEKGGKPKWTQLSMWL